MVAVLVSTTTIVSMDFAHAKAYIDVKDDFTISMVARFFILLAKCGLIFFLYKKRLGFTFLTHYTKIPLVRENAGEYLYMIVLIVGMFYRHALRDHVFSAVMPIQMLSMAVFLFIYVMLSKELSFQR